MSSLTADARRLARRTAKNPAMEHLARLGFVAYGVVHLLVAWLALQIATGQPPREGDEGGALKTLAAQPLGGALLFACAAGLAALALWQGVEAATGHRRERGRNRVVERTVSGARATVYAILAWTAAGLLMGKSTAKSDQQQTATAGLMGEPGGPLLVGLIGLGILSFGVGLAGYGLLHRFERHLRPHPAPMRWLGVAGYAAKGTAYAVLGGLVVTAATTYDPSRSRGLDAALHTIAAQPYGHALLIAVALGIAAYGAFAIAEARYAKV